ncbi:hypothetical protein BD414DRAFT_487580 [Trametes punicea]|nr:hypothetical protein BD414DRAFT_487580 [Trametes punicea]
MARHSGTSRPQVGSRVAPLTLITLVRAHQIMSKATNAQYSTSLLSLSPPLWQLTLSIASASRESPNSPRASTDKHFRKIRCRVVS